MHAFLEALKPYLNTFAASCGAGLAGYIVTRVLGPRVLAKFANTKARASLLEEGAEFAIKHLAGPVAATPNKLDDLGLEVVKAIESWAETTRVALTTREQKKLKSAVHRKLKKSQPQENK